MVTLQQLNVALQEARTEIDGPVRAALQTLGFSLREIEALAPEEVLRRLADQASFTTEEVKALAVVFDEDAALSIASLDTISTDFTDDSVTNAAKVTEAWDKFRSFLDKELTNAVGGFISDVEHVIDLASRPIDFVINFGGSVQGGAWLGLAQRAFGLGFGGVGSELFNTFAGNESIFGDVAGLVGVANPFEVARNRAINQTPVDYGSYAQIEAAYAGTPLDPNAGRSTLTGYTGTDVATGNVLC